MRISDVLLSLCIALVLLVAILYKANTASAYEYRCDKEIDQCYYIDPRI